jgi:hypothetical protein
LKPTVLVAATSHWFPTARLAMALAEAGCVVEAVCPPRHPLCVTKAVRQTHTYRGLAPLMSLAKAIRAAKPDLIIPGDDLATRHLHHLYRRELAREQEGSTVCALIERSFGAPESFPIVYERASFMRAAEEEGIRVPKSAPITNLKELQRWTSQMGFPIVLKADGTSGGDGVRVARTLEEAEKAFRTLQAPPLLARAAKRAVINRDKTLVWPSILRRRSAVSAQTFIEGHEATSMVACWKGTVLAGLHFEVIKKRYAAGPATVMRLVDHAEIATAVEKMVRRLNLSGLHGFDFMLEAQTGDAYLIEINPRTTQVGHLAFGPGRDLATALVAALTGSTVQARTKVGNETVALFPQEWTRDAASDFVLSGYHDVPWEEPELLAACIRQAQKQRNLKVPSIQRAASPAIVAPQQPRPISEPAAAIPSELSECRHE